MIVFAVTDPESKRNGVSVFLVDIRHAGLQHLARDRRRWATTGIRSRCPSSTAACRTRTSSASRATAGSSPGQQLLHGRLKIAAYQLGIAQRCIDIAVDYAQQRVTWGKPIAARQAVQFMLADSRVELEAARLLVYRSAWKADQGLDHAQDDYMAKLYATEMSRRVTDRALQILGGVGYAIETPVQSFYRQARSGGSATAPRRSTAG